MGQDHFQESIDTFKVKFEGGNSIDAELFKRLLNSSQTLLACYKVSVLRC